jgi:hypothetical protein
MKTMKVTSVLRNLKLILPFLGIVPLHNFMKPKHLECKENTADPKLFLENLGNIDKK